MNLRIFQVFLVISISLISIAQFADAKNYGVYEDYYIKYGPTTYEIDYSSSKVYQENVSFLINILDKIFIYFDNTELEFTGVDSRGAYITYTDHNTGEIVQSGFVQYGVMNDNAIPLIISIDSTWGDSVYVKDPDNYRHSVMKLDYSGIIEDHGIDHFEFTSPRQEEGGDSEMRLYYDSNTGFFTGFEFDIDMDDGVDSMSGYYEVLSYEIGTYVYGPIDSDGDGITDDKDNCIFSAETYNGYQDLDGCPDTRPSIPITSYPPSSSADVTIARDSAEPGCERNNKCYLPHTIYVKERNSLTWYNADAAAHTVTSGTPERGANGVFDSSILMSGDSFSHRFDREGTFPYYCLVHPWMEGTVVVESVYIPPPTPRDTTPPKILKPTDIVVDAENQNGTNVTYEVLAIDETDEIVRTSCNPSSGKLFAVGKTTVTCNATDSAGNKANNVSFTVTVKSASTAIPSWIKNVAGFWCKEKIDDKSFVEGIQYLIDNGIIRVKATPSGSGGTDNIPAWIKNNACWWSDGAISDKDFTSGIEFLVEKGIIKVSSSETKTIVRESIVREPIISGKEFSSEKLGFSIITPKNWEHYDWSSDEGALDVQLRAPNFVFGIGPEINVDHPTDNNWRTLDDAIREEKEWIGYMANTKINDEKIITVNGYDGYLIEFEGDALNADVSASIKTHKIILKTTNGFYIIDYTDTLKRFSSFEKVGQDALNSFRIS